jgi:hypothetical protein
MGYRAVFSLANQTLLICIDHGLTGTSTFFYKWAPNMLAKKSGGCSLETCEAQLTRVLHPGLLGKANEENSLFEQPANLSPC